LKGIEDVVTDRSLSVYAQDVVKFLLWFVYLVAVAFIVYAWFNLLTGAGDEEKSKKSKGMIIYVVIWILIIFLAWPITQFILNILNSTSTS
jgi:Na+-driven multidrug efflux pump